VAEPDASANARPKPSLGPALVLVGNTVSHDARVLREAAALRELGFTVTVAGVVSTLESRIDLRPVDVPAVGHPCPRAIARVPLAEATPSVTI
jgi:hypothetical protein